MHTRKNSLKSVRFVGRQLNVTKAVNEKQEACTAASGQHGHGQKQVDQDGLGVHGSTLVEMRVEDFAQAAIAISRLLNLVWGGDRRGAVCADEFGPDQVPVMRAKIPSLYGVPGCGLNCRTPRHRNGSIQGHPLAYRRRRDANSASHLSDAAACLDSSGDGCRCGAHAPEFSTALEHV